jgi:hypothetical protein
MTVFTVRALDAFDAGMVMVGFLPKEPDTVTDDVVEDCAGEPPQPASKAMASRGNMSVTAKRRIGKPCHLRG